MSDTNVVDPLIEKVTNRLAGYGETYHVDTDGLIRYVVEGLQPGGFLTAVLENNLIEAASRADDWNQRKLYEWACIIYNGVPMDAKGSRENVSKWLRHGGLRGLIAERQEPDPDPVVLS